MAWGGMPVATPDIASRAAWAHRRRDELAERGRPVHVVPLPSSGPRSSTVLGGRLVACVLGSAAAALIAAVTAG